MSGRRCRKCEWDMRSGDQRGGGGGGRAGAYHPARHRHDGNKDRLPVPKYAAVVDAQVIHTLIVASVGGGAEMVSCEMATSLPTALCFAPVCDVSLRRRPGGLSHLLFDRT